MRILGEIVTIIKGRTKISEENPIEETMGDNMIVNTTIEIASTMDKMIVSTNGGKIAEMTIEMIVRMDQKTK